MAQYESELSGQEEFKDFRKVRAKKDRSSSPSPLKIKKIKKTISIGSPPLPKIVSKSQNVEIEQIPMPKLKKSNNEETSYSESCSTVVSTDSSDRENDDEFKDPDYSTRGEFLIFFFSFV